MNTDNPANVKPPFQDLQRYVMFAPAPNNAQLRSVLTWGLRDGFPYITVRTNLPEDKDKNYGMITVSFTPTEFKMLLDDINKITLGERGQRASVECYTTKAKEDGTRSEPFLTGTVHYGKSKKGINWISVQAVDRPEIYFEFKPTRFHVWKTTDGKTIDDAEMSNRAAAALLHDLDKIYASMTGVIRPPYTGPKKGPAKKSETKANGFDDFDDIPL